MPFYIKGLGLCRLFFSVEVQELVSHVYWQAFSQSQPPPPSLSLLQHQLQSLKCQTPSKCHLSLIGVRSEVLFHGEFYFELSGRYNFEVLCLHRCWGMEFWSVCSPLYCQNPSLNNLLFLAYFKLCFLKRPVLGQARWLSGLRYLVPSLTG